MSKSSLCDYSDVFIFMKITITITRGPAKADESPKQVDEKNKEVIFENCAPFTYCISKIDKQIGR